MNSLLRVFITLRVSGFLFYLAYPRLHASLLYLPVDTAISNYWDSGEIPLGQLKGLQQRASESIAIHPHYRYWDGLSFLYLLEGADTSKKLFERREAFEQSIEAAQISLGRAPSQPRAWFRIARAGAWLRYPAAEVIAALKMAIYTGRVDPSLFMARLMLGMSYLPVMDEEASGLMRDQAVLAWQLQPREVTRAINDGLLSLPRLEELLGGTHPVVIAGIKETVDGSVR
jgi:hypothetical protein